MFRTKRFSPGFTLIELLVSMGLASFILVGVLMSFLMIGRMGANVQNYTEIESKARKVLEQFSREARLAYNMDDGVSTSVAFSGNSSTQVRFYIPDSNSTNRTGTSTGAYTVTYAISGSNFTRTGPPITDPTGASSTTILMTNVQQIGSTPYLNFYKHLPTSTNYNTALTTPNSAVSYLEAQQIEVNFLVYRTSTTVTKATNKVLSARFILRNK